MAERALAAYARIAPENRLDQNDCIPFSVPPQQVVLDRTLIGRPSSACTDLTKAAAVMTAIAAVVIFKSWM